MSYVIAALLGTWHGLNPAMGWLFAAALGLQERRASAVVAALPPIFLGHATSVAAVVLLAAGARRVVPPDAMRWGGGALLLGYALLLLVRRRHAGRVGMRVGTRGLFAWSFVMATAHGAGLMLLPLLLAAGAPGSEHAHHAGASGGLVLLAHTMAMLLATTGAALAAFRLSGVAFLRRAWLDTRVAWSLALAGSGMAVVAG